MTAYTQQLDQKIQYLQQLFQGLDFPEIQVFESPEQHYRMRAEFRIWHEGGEMFYAMFELSIIHLSEPTRPAET